MVFSSLTFLLIFLPATLAVYFACRSVRFRNVVLLIASLVFYAWGEPVYVFVMAFVTFAVYAGALAFGAVKSPLEKAVSHTVADSVAWRDCFISSTLRFLRISSCPFLA
jgi:alginate O-acetyltransferase complex protein AlgI